MAYELHSDHEASRGIGGNHVAGTPSERSSAAVAFAAIGRQLHETDTIMEALVREYYKARHFGDLRRKLAGSPNGRDSARDF